MNEKNELLQAALSYAERGWAVCPLKPRDKQPLTAHGCQDATTDTATIRGWWQQYPNANVGIEASRSHLVFVDIDKNERVDGWESWRDLKAKLGRDIENTVMVKTPGGGGHVYYRLNGQRLANMTEGRLAPGIGIRAVNECVVAPPSTHPNGRRYEWDVAPDECEVMAIPAPLEALILSAQQQQEKTESAPAEGEVIPEGQRNNRLTSLAGTMRRKGASYDVILGALVAENEHCEPPLTRAEVEKIAASVARYAPAEVATTREWDALTFTEMGNAERFAEMNRADIRYCEPLGGWLVWDGVRWHADNSGEILRRMKELARQLQRDAAEEEPGSDRAKAMWNWATRSASEHVIHSTLNLAWNEPGILLQPDAFDSDPWLLNCANGVLDLRTGILREHRPEDYMTKLAPVAYDPDATDPVLERYLQTVTRDNPDLQSYLQRAAGYSLTGSTREEVFFLMLGPANSGKSTFVEMMLALLGDYGHKASFDSFLESSRVNPGGARSDIVALRGARMVGAIETAKTRQMAEPMIKELTGGDTVSVRALYKEPISFRPSCKLWLAANFSPRLSDDDSGIWRRLKRIPFEMQLAPGENDPGMKEHLLNDPAAQSAILAWAVNGCLMWQAGGLDKCQVVEQATTALRVSFDPIAEFLEGYCLMDVKATVPANELRRAYESWAAENGARPINNKEWGNRLRNMGCESFREQTGNERNTVWHGIGLLK